MFHVDKDIRPKVKRIVVINLLSPLYLLTIRNPTHQMTNLFQELIS